MEMQVVDRLLCGFPVCVEKVEPGGPDPLAIALKQHLRGSEYVGTQFGWAVPEIRIMMLADDQGMAVNVRFEREEANQTLRLTHDASRRLLASNSTKDAISMLLQGQPHQ